MGTDLQGPFTSRFQTHWVMRFTQAENADARAEALFRVRLFTDDDIDQRLGAGAIGRSIAANPLRCPVGISTV